MTVLVTGLEVGPDVDRLSQATGYPHQFVSEIVTRMRQAHLWSDTAIDSPGVVG